MAEEIEEWSKWFHTECELQIGDYIQVEAMCYCTKREIHEGIVTSVDGPRCGLLPQPTTTLCVPLVTRWRKRIHRILDDVEDERERELEDQ